MSYPDVRRALDSDQETLGALWTNLLDEQAEQDDRMTIADDARERWDNDFPVWLEDKTRRLYVAEPADEVVGFASARRWGPPPIYKDQGEVFLDEIYVAPAERRKGLGTQLLAAVRDWSDEVGAHRIRLRVLAANDDAHDFWASQDAVPLTTTLTIERPGSAATEENEGSKKIGF